MPNTADFDSTIVFFKPVEVEIKVETLLFGTWKQKVSGLECRQCGFKAYNPYFTYHACTSWKN